MITAKILECVLIGVPQGSNHCNGDNALKLDGDHQTLSLIGWSLRKGLLDIEWSMLPSGLDESEGQGFFLISRPVAEKASEISLKHFKSKRFAMDKL